MDIHTHDENQKSFFPPPFFSFRGTVANLTRAHAYEKEKVNPEQFILKL